MRWSDWKTWVVIAGGVFVAFVIYSLASSEPTLSTPRVTSRVSAPSAATNSQAPQGIEAIHTEWLEPKAGSYRSERNLFAFVEPPPPKPPELPPPQLPPDTDKDGVADYMDNCVSVANPDQLDVDRNGIGAACQEGQEIPPPPPPPKPPQFPYKYLGTFGTTARPIASFSAGDEIVNVRVGQTFGGGKFILLNIGIESVDIGYVGFPPDVRTRIAVGQ